jgi:hypothetical protein
MYRGGVLARCAAFTLVGAAALAFAGGASAAPTGTVMRVGPNRINPMDPFGKVNNDTVTSSNWSGYAVQDASKFTDVRGSWVQPAVTCHSSTAQYAAFWAGIDGYSSDSVEQLGTDSDCLSNNTASYYAWWEMYPANSVELSTSTYPVKAGDRLYADVSVSGTSFTLTLESSEGWTFTTTKTGSGLAQSSAELIAESPEICGVTCKLAQHSDFGTVKFSAAQAAVNGGADAPFSTYTADSGPHDIIAETSNGTVRAQPTSLSANGKAFNIAWKHD